MQISLKWVNELVNIKKVNLDYLLEKLTLGGFEVEKVIELELNGEKILILDISATANRSDSLSIKGISKEIAILLNKPYKKSKYLNETLNWDEQFRDVISNYKLKKSYLSFLAFTLENLSDLNSPKWLKQKLFESGVEPVNNFLDFQNYILLESGYPFEVYDLNKIRLKLNSKEFNLSLIKAKTNEKFISNNNSIYNLNESILTLKANNLNLSIAGIIPSKEFAYSDNSTSLLIEASIFEATSIRQQSRLLGLRTNRSSRYEKSIKSMGLLNSVYKLIKLLKVRNPNLICKIHTKGQIFEEESNIIILEYRKINDILGPIKSSGLNELVYISPALISKYFDQLRFAYIFKPNQLIWEVTIPNSRIDDISRPIDLIEEIARLHGFNKFLTQLPFTRIAGIEDVSYRAKKKLTLSLLNSGLNELIHYSLNNDSIISNRPVELINPLVTEYSNLRASLLPGIIKTVQENLKQGNSYIEGFEYGHVFSKNIHLFNSRTKLQEQEYISGVFGGNKIKTDWSEDSKQLEWAQAKWKIERILRQFRCLTVWEPYSGEFYKNILHPTKACEISIYGGRKIGVFGQIHPILAKKLNISPDLYLFELNFGVLKNSFKNNHVRKFTPYVSYPKIVKNISFIVDCKVPYIEIRNLLIRNGTIWLTNVLLLDHYQGISIPENEVSLCLELTFQSNKQTLQNKDVEEIIKNLLVLLIRRFNILIRL